MMINKRLIAAVGESKKYIAANVALQWVSLAANILIMGVFCRVLAGLYAGAPARGALMRAALLVLAAVVVRIACGVGASRMAFLSSRAVKLRLRGLVYDKLLRLGASYREQVSTGEVVQVAVEGVDQLETYFGAYLPQFFYAMLAPLTLFAVLCRVNLPAATVLLVCVPLIPVAIAAVQTWAKKLLSKYWGQYTALGDTFLENLQGLTTLKIYQADGFKNEEMNRESEKFRRITMKVLAMQLNSITIMDLVAYGGAGPLHAVHLAQEMGIHTVLIPPAPGALCALGLLTADIKKSYVKTALIPYDQATPEQINQAVLPLMEEGSRWLASENVPEQRRQFHNVAEMRYVGQNYELQVEIPAGLVDQADLDRMKEDFFRAHEMNYGYYNPNAPVQFVNFRSEAIGQVQKPRLAELTGHMETPSGAVIDHRDVYFEESGLVRCPVYDRSKFGRCPRVDGPCIVEQMDSTTVIPPNTWFEVDIHGNLIVNAFGDGKGGDEA